MAGEAHWTRRDVLAAGALAAAGGLAAGAPAPFVSAPPPERGGGGGDGGGDGGDDPPYRISLAEWSLHRTIRRGEMDNLDFPRVARETYGLDAIEYVSAFFEGKARDEAYLGELRDRCTDAGVRSLLIMVDGEGALGDPDEAGRLRAVDNHRKWLDAATFLGCHSIRVNAHSSGTPQEQKELVVDGLRRLSELGAERGLNVLVENHGGLSSNGAWLASVIGAVDHPACGTLPDFGNFCMDRSRADDPDAWYDRYQGVEELMPFAKAVSAKSREFDDEGEEVQTDFRRMMEIVTGAGYDGYVGIEWEGSHVSEHEGIMLTKRLLERIREEMA